MVADAILVLEICHVDSTHLNGCQITQWLWAIKNRHPHSRRSRPIFQTTAKAADEYMSLPHAQLAAMIDSILLAAFAAVALARGSTSPCPEQPESRTTNCERCVGYRKLNVYVE